MGGKPKLKLEGRVFNRLTVIKFAYIKQAYTYWECICSCPNKTIVIIKGTALMNGNTKSCGCIKIERLVAGTLPAEHHKKWKHDNYLKNREKVLKKVKKYWDEHKEQISAKSKLVRKQNSEKIKGRDKVYYERKKKGRFLTAESRFKRGQVTAKQRKIYWGLTLEEYIILISNPCYYCGALLSSSVGVSLDRIDNDKAIGYIKNNVLPCCGICNQTRGNTWTVEEMKVMITAVLEFRNKNASY